MTERWSGCIKEDEEEKEEIMSGGGAPESREAKVSGARIQQRWRQRWSDGGALIRHRTNAPLSLYTLAGGERTTRGMDMDGWAGAVPRYEKERWREKRATAIEPTQKSRKQTAFDRFRHTFACKRISARRRWTDKSKDGDINPTPPGTDLTLLQGALVNMFLPFFLAVFESFSSPTFVYFL